jgi:hypothetical protein
MTIDRAGQSQQKIADAKSDVRLRLGQLSDETLHRVAVWVAGGSVASGVGFAASNVGSEQHTWWGWLLIGVPLAWVSFLGVVALTFGVLRVASGILRRPPSSSGGGADASAPTASRWAGPQVCQFDVSIKGLAGAA